MDAATRSDIMSRYGRHLARLERAVEDRRRGLSAEDDGDDGSLPLPPAASFTPSESIVLTLIARGFTDAEIGRLIAISPNTVKAHVRHLLAKLNARNRAHAVARAIECDVLRPPYRLAPGRRRRHELEPDPARQDEPH